MSKESVHTASIFYTVLLTVSVVYMVLVLALYVVRRARPPLPFWYPRVMIGTNILLVLHTLCITLMRAVVHPSSGVSRMSMLEIGLPLAILYSLLIDGFVCAAALFYTAVEIARLQLLLVNYEKVIEKESSKKLINTQTSLLNDDDSSTINELRRAKKILVRLQRLRMASRPLAVIFAMLFNTLVLIIPFSTFLLIHPDVANTPSSECSSNENVECQQLTRLAMIKITLSVGAVIFLSLKLRLTTDVLGLKAGLCKIAVLFMFSFISYAALRAPLHAWLGSEWDVPVLMTVTTNHAVFFISIVQPLRASFVYDNFIEITSNGTANNNIVLLEAFMRTSKGFDAIVKHLKLEFCVENALFFRAVTNFENDFTPSDSSSHGIGRKRLSSLIVGDRFHHLMTIGKSFTENSSQRSKRAYSEPNCCDETMQMLKMKESAEKIFWMFLSTNAPSQVNLPGHMIDKFRRVMFASLNASQSQNNLFMSWGSSDKVWPKASNQNVVEAQTPITFDMFSAAKREVLKLVFSNSFRRFVSTKQNSELWATFCSGHAEKQSMNAGMSLMKTPMEKNKMLQNSSSFQIISNLNRQANIGTSLSTQ